MKFTVCIALLVFCPLWLFAQSACDGDGLHCACPKTGWCRIWPPLGGPTTPAQMRSNGWASLLPDPDHQQFYFFGMDNGLVTFANAWWAMPWKNWVKSERPAAEAQVWTFLTDCGTGELPRRAIRGEHLTLIHSIRADDADSLELGLLDGRLSGPFPQQGVVVLQDPEGEAIHYSGCDQADARDQIVTPGDCPAGSRRLILRHLTRAFLSNSGYSAVARSHTAGLLVHQACPAPRNMRGPLSAHPSDQHPVRDSAYDSRRRRIWNFGGYNETYSLRETWYMPVEGQNAYQWFRFLTPTLQPAETEAGGIYDPAHDVILRYGGIYSPAALWLLCFAKNAAIGCSRANDWNKVEGTRGSSPGPRFGYSLVWDSASQSILIYGGDKSNPHADQVYAYNVGTRTWAQLGPASGAVPPRQKFPPLAFDPVRGKQGTLTLYAAEGSLYEFDIATTTWSKRTDICTAAPRGPGKCDILNACYLGYDSVNDQYVYLGKPDVPVVWTLPGATLSTSARPCN